MLGAIIGDLVGSIYEFNNLRSKDFELLTDKNFITDDSIMTFAVCEIIQNRWYVDKDKVIDTFKKWGRAYPNYGYGGRFNHWLFSNDRESYKSYGNGAAMRISPVGWYARNEQEVKDLSRYVTEVTHSHKEGLKGAEVTAMCIYYARIGKSKEFIKKYVEQYYDINFDYEELKKNYYFNETCQETVPQAIYCFLISTSFEDCLRTSISIGGDSDTLAAISCAIAEAYYKYIDIELIKKVIEYLPKSKDNCDLYNLFLTFLEDKLDILVFNEEISDNTKVICKQIIYDDKVEFDWYTSSSLDILKENLIFNDLDYIIGIDEDFPSKMYLKERNLKSYILELEHKYKTFPSNMYNILNNILLSDEKTFNDKLNALNEVLNTNVKYLFFKNPKEALVYANDIDKEHKLYRVLFEKDII